MIILLKLLPCLIAAPKRRRWLVPSPKRRVPKGWHRHVLRT